MPIPTGNPAWLHTNDHTHYGGNVNKTNYEGVGTVNPRTDVSAENLCRIAADLAAIQRTAPFAIMVYTTNDVSPDNPTIDYYSSMVGAQPSGLRVSDGNANFTWNASYNDPYSQPGNIHIVGAVATVLTSNAYFATASLSDPDVNGLNERIQIAVVDDAGAAVQDVQVMLTIYTGSGV